MSTPWSRLLGPSTFLTAGYGKVSVTVTRHDTGDTATLDALDWDASADTMTGPMEEEASSIRRRFLFDKIEVATEVGRALEIEDAITLNGQTYKVITLSPDPTGIETMVEVEVERIDRLAGYADGEDRAR